MAPLALPWVRQWLGSRSRRAEVNRSTGKRKAARGDAAMIVVTAEICKGTGCPANLLCSFTSLIFLTTPLRVDKKLSVRQNGPFSQHALCPPILNDLPFYGHSLFCLPPRGRRYRGRGDGGHACPRFRILGDVPRNRFIREKFPTIYHNV